MLDRIERIARVKGVDSGVGRSFERKEGYNENKKDKRSFDKTLTKEMDKDVPSADKAGLNAMNAYSLDISSRPTQSLFYRDLVDIIGLEGKINIKS